MEKDLSIPEARLNFLNSNELDLNQASQVWRKVFPDIKALFETSIKTPWGDVKTFTHTLGLNLESLTFIPFNDANGMKQPHLEKHFNEGEIGIAIKHHSTRPDPDSVEMMKFQTTHIQIIVGVDKGVLTINNPRGYCNGGFGGADYPSIFIKPQYPSGLSNNEIKMYQDNIRTWLILANKFSEFPGNYNGSDPLKCITKEAILEFGKALINATLGDNQAIDWLKLPEQKLYCAELAFLAFNLGFHFPLNEENVGTQFASLVTELEKKSFLVEHENPYIKTIEIKPAPTELKPISQLVPLNTSSNSPFWEGLAVIPYSAADIVIEFLRRAIPRHKLGEIKGSAIQSALFNKLRPNFHQVLQLDSLVTKAEFDGLLDEINAVISYAYPDYKAFRKKIEPALEKLHLFSIKYGLAYIPPHCFLLRAYDSINKDYDLGILGWKYIGHGFDQSLFK